MAATELIIAMSVFIMGAALGLLAVVSIGIRREERIFRPNGDTSIRKEKLFRLRGDTPIHRVGITLWSIVHDPKRNSEITRTQGGDLTVSNE